MKGGNTKPLLPPFLPGVPHYAKGLRIRITAPVLSAARRQTSPQEVDASGEALDESGGDIVSVWVESLDERVRSRWTERPG